VLQGSVQPALRATLAGGVLQVGSLSLSSSYFVIGQPAVVVQTGNVRSCCVIPEVSSIVYVVAKEGS